MLAGSYVQSVPFDRVEKMEDGTYEISLFRRLHAKDWLKFPGQLSFRCFMIVMSTTWRRGIHHRLFGDAGCVIPPPNVKNGYYNITSENTCWQTPREGSRISYSCLNGLELLGPEQLICRNGTWKATPSPRKIDPTSFANGNTSNNNNKIYTRRLIPRGPQITVCSKCCHFYSTFLCSGLHSVLFYSNSMFHAVCTLCRLLCFGELFCLCFLSTSLTYSFVPHSR